ncbi:MAG TPA: hypothetical protein VIV61_00160, partial [Candidatus Ozemobacteraceae bacterium]
ATKSARQTPAGTRIRPRKIHPASLFKKPEPDGTGFKGKAPIEGTSAAGGITDISLFLQVLLYSIAISILALGILPDLSFST